MNIRAKFFHRKAKECGALAETMTDQFSRMELKRTAAHWLSLAESADLLDRFRRERDRSENAEPLAA